MSLLATDLLFYFIFIFQEKKRKKNNGLMAAVSSASTENCIGERSHNAKDWNGIRHVVAKWQAG